jgi:hypothetical protein
MWMEVAIVASMFAVGNILFGHFEEGAPKWRRVAKFFLTVGAVVLVSATAGRAWAFALIGVMLAGAAVIHAWWLPRHGIDGWTGEPREKYDELRGWKRRDY